MLSNALNKHTHAHACYRMPIRMWERPRWRFLERTTAFPHPQYQISMKFAALVCGITPTAEEANRNLIIYTEFSSQ